MDNKVNCVCSILYEIKDFASLNEFKKLEKYITDLVNSGDLVEIPVGKHYAGFSEKWYKCNGCSQKWSLVYPDFPFKGLWMKI